MRGVNATLLQQPEIHLTARSDGIMMLKKESLNLITPNVILYYQKKLILTAFLNINTDRIMGKYPGRGVNHKKNNSFLFPMESLM